jgi:hypothetical protein
MLDHGGSDVLDALHVGRVTLPSTLESEALALACLELTHGEFVVLLVVLDPDGVATQVLRSTNQAS